MAEEKQEESLFTPDLDTERKYKEQVKILLESGGSKSEIIDMGRLPEIYIALGIKDRELKTNGKALLKALGIEGKNKHDVPKETVEELLSLTYNPEAVFKSLSTSNNPNAYVAVLNAKTEKQEQIIAILSPSHDGRGYTFIPSVYEKHNFDRFISRTFDEHKILYIKNKGSQLWGKLQSLPRHNQEPSIKNILTKNDIVKRLISKMPKQGENASLERSNFYNKENIMSDERQEISDQVDDYLSELNTTMPISEGEKELSPKEKAFKDAVINATHQRKVIADAIKEGTLCCLPGKDGYADTTPAVNIMSPNKPYHGENLLFLKAFQNQEQNGFPTAEFVTYHQIDKAREEGLDLYVMKGQKGVSLIIGEQKDNGEWENKKIVLFNVAQLNKPELIKEWANKKIEEQAQKDLEYQRIRHGSGWTPPEKQKEHGPDVIVCSSTEPEKYLGQYLAAVSFGSKFKASPEQAAEFSEKMISSLYRPMEPKVNEKGEVIREPPKNHSTGQPITDPFSLEKISRGANAECKIFMTQTRMTAATLSQPEQKQEQAQSLRRGM